MGGTVMRSRVSTRPHLAADQAVAATAQDQHGVHVLMALERGEAARRHLEMAQPPASGSENSTCRVID